jgi:argininosuccinate synthase
MKQKIVLAYSGGLDTSIILAWLKETYDAEIITFTADVGQGEELEGLEAKALATGASKVYIDDLRAEFAQDYIFPMFQSGALYEGQYLLGTSIARPLIARRMVEIAHAEGATAIAHGATGKGNDQVRFELGAAAIAPEIQVIAPWRLPEFRATFPGRAEMIAYAEAHGIPVHASAAKPYSTDRNLLHISFEAGILEDPWFDASAEENKDMFVMSVAPEDAPDKPEYVELTFAQGNVIAINDVAMNPLQVMEELNRLGGKHGIGRVDMVENRFVGMKSRGVYETPGGTILFTAHRKMESLTMDREVMHIRDGLLAKYAELVYNGFWFAPERIALQAFVTESQVNVSGTVRLKLYKGNIIAAGLKSPVSLYNANIATMEGSAPVGSDGDNADAGDTKEASSFEAYDQADANGFIKLNALRLKVAAAAAEQHGAHEA